jgi:hypothetical protein
LIRLRLTLILSPATAIVAMLFFVRRVIKCRHESEAAGKLLAFEPIGFENPPEDSQTEGQEFYGHHQTEIDAYVRGAVEAPAETANQDP